MVPPIQVVVHVNLPVKCARDGCDRVISDRRTAVFIVRHIMVVAYCCSECYLYTWRAQLSGDDAERVKEEFLDELGYYK